MLVRKTLPQVVNSLPFWLDNWGMSSQTQVEEVLDLSKFFDHLWVTIVWDDPVNLMNYVTYVFIKLFGFSKEKAHELMMQVHNEGKAVVASGTREEMEHGLWATLQREDHGRV
jgi:ATP-dependent Clp protease adaptor protein ClpS